MPESFVFFYPHEVKGALAGLKTQIRRPVRWRPYDAAASRFNLSFSGLEAGYYCSDLPASGWVLRSRGGSCWNDRTKPEHCPYGLPGARLWVQENFSLHDIDRDEDRWSIVYAADGKWAGVYDPEKRDRPHTWEVRYSGIFLPRFAARLFFEVTAVRVEPLHRMTSDDAYADCGGVVGSYTWLWDKRFAKKGFAWKDNPWTWAVDIKPVASLAGVAA